jgi:Uma2 family endonuclease
MSAAPQLDPSRLATYEDLLNYPENERVEILDGVVVAQASPLPEHSNVQLGLAAILRAAFQYGRGGPGGWWILGDVDVRVGAHDIVRPDLVGWRQERLPSPWGKRPIDIVPDWVCEVVSPYGKTRDRIKKRQLYARHGVPYYWMIDPAGIIETLVLEKGRWIVADAYELDAVVRIPPFDAIELQLADIFPPDESKPAG